MSWRHLVKRWLLKRGMILSRPPGQFNEFEYKLRAAKARGLQIGSVVDGGAANGGWAREVRAVFPEARLLCIEPRPDVQPELERLREELGRVDIAPVVLSAAEGEVDFFFNADWSSTNASFSSGGAAAATASATRVQATTLDALVDRLGFPGPDLIKLDLQGYELTALAGATQCLTRARAVLVEVSFLGFCGPEAPLIADVIAFMRERDFLAYDVLGLWHRPLDGTMAQADVLFLRSGDPLRADQRYAP